MMFLYIFSSLGLTPTEDPTHDLSNARIGHQKQHGRALLFCSDRKGKYNYFIGVFETDKPIVPG